MWDAFHRELVASVSHGLSSERNPPGAAFLRVPQTEITPTQLNIALPHFGQFVLHFHCLLVKYNLILTHKMSGKKGILRARPSLASVPQTEITLGSTLHSPTLLNGGIDSDLLKVLFKVLLLAPFF